jgi:probable rRNA maturation factor
MADHDITIEIEADLPVAAAELRAVVEMALLAALAGEETAAELSVLFTGSDHIQQLNRDFLGTDKPTDVLSFPAGVALPGMVLPGMPRYLGDIAIAVPVALAQAEAAGHGFLDEVALLVVHGLLHLLGYDHATPDEQAAMWQVQDAVLAELGLALRSPSFGAAAEE